MRRRGRPEKLLPGAVLTLCLAVVGTGYAYWNGNLRVEEKFSTGEFDCTFSETGSVTAEIRTADRTETEEVPVQVTTDAVGKSAALTFPEGVPEAFLNGEKELCIRCPIAEKGVKVKTGEPDFTKEGEKVTLTPEAVYLALPEGIYTLETPDARFMTERTAELYQSAEEIDGTLYACLYLRAAKEIAPVELPEQLAVTEEQLTALPLADCDFPENGIWVSYAFETDLLLEQAQGGQTGDTVGFGALTAYAYWTDRLKLTGKAAIQVPVNLVLYDAAGETIPDGALFDDRATATNARTAQDTAEGTP
jgi:hypothetical protein